MTDPAVRRSALAGWLAITALVVVWDVACGRFGRETLSGFVWRHARRRHLRYLTWAIWTGLGIHLLYERP